jgi:long-chain acyl-CoA synthetase
MNVEKAAVRRSPVGDLGWPLKRAARQLGSADAIVDAERTVTYSQLAGRVAALGASLDALAVGLGGRVGFLGVNSLAHVECWLGLPAFGRVMVDLNFRLAEPELAFMIDDCELEVLIVDRDQLDVGRALRQRCATLRELILDGTGDCPTDCSPYEELLNADPLGPPEIEEHTLAAISYTGGTTGTPKGVMLSHGNLLANARHNLIATGHQQTDCWLHVCPMFHVAGTANVLASTWVGGRQVVLPRFSGRAVAETITRERITHTVLVPTMLAMLLDHLEREPFDLSSLCHIQYAASPISSELQQRLLDRFDCDVAQFYGMTEAAPTVAHCSPEDHRRGFAGEEPYRSRLASSGTAVVGVECEVRGPEASPLPPGEIGEIWVRGPNVMLGYWNRPEATRSALVDGWYRTGDAAYADTDGYLYIVDRLKDMIISGGENVYSIEVEGALLEHDAVLEAAVFGIPDRRWGEAVHGVVSVRADGSVTADELISYCRERIAAYKVPRSIEIRSDPLPKSGAGKLLKNTLRDPYWAGRERHVS